MRVRINVRLVDDDVCSNLFQSPPLFSGGAECVYCLTSAAISFTLFAIGFSGLSPKESGRTAPALIAVYAVTVLSLSVVLGGDIHTDGDLATLPDQSPHSLLQPHASILNLTPRHTPRPISSLLSRCLVNLDATAETKPLRSPLLE